MMTLKSAFLLLYYYIKNQCIITILGKKTELGVTVDRNHKPFPLILSFVKGWKWDMKETGGSCSPFVQGPETLYLPPTNAESFPVLLLREAAEAWPKPWGPDQHGLNNAIQGLITIPWGEGSLPLAMFPLAHNLITLTTALHLHHLRNPRQLTHVSHLDVIRSF